MTPHAMPRTRRIRPAAFALHGGASSMLRLTPAAAPRLPSGEGLARWVQRAAGAMAADMVAIGEHSSTALVTPLAPSAALSWR
jgi:hypothetical protein